MTECSPLCFEGRGVCNIETLTCTCGWEFGGDDCSKTFYQVLGHSYLGYNLFSLVLTSLVFGFSSLVLEKSIEWKVTKLDFPQKLSLFFLSIGSLARIFFHILTVSGYRENRIGTPILPALFGYYIVSILCSYSLVLLLWVELWISISKTRKIETSRTKKLFFGITVTLFGSSTVLLLIGGIYRKTAMMIITSSTSALLLLTVILTISFLIFGACNGRSLYRIMSTFKGKKKAILFNRITIFTIAVTLVMLLTSVYLAAMVAVRAFFRTDIFIPYSIAARILEFIASSILIINYYLALKHWSTASPSGTSDKITATENILKTSAGGSLNNSDAL